MGEEEQNSRKEQRVRVRVVGMSVPLAKDTFASIVMFSVMRWCIIVLDALVVVLQEMEVMEMEMWLWMEMDMRMEVSRAMAMGLLWRRDRPLNGRESESK
jgi:hypothetical protein